MRSPRLMSRLRSTRPRMLFLALLLASSAPVRAEGPEAALIGVALGKLDALEVVQDPAAFGEAQALARTALELAGQGCLPGLATRLGQGGRRCEIAAWALGEISPEGEDAPAMVVTALRKAAVSGDWDCRLACLSTLGRLEIAAATGETLAAFRDPFRPPGTEAVMLLAVMGCGGEGAEDLLGEMLGRGGGEAWSALIISAALRRGPASWPVLVEEACSNPDPMIRGTASLALLLLAEPLAGCRLAECSATEPDPAIRRLKYQALGAGGSPSGRALLVHAAAFEEDREMREAAASLALLPLQAPSRTRLGVSSAEVRHALAQLALAPRGPATLRDIEAGASSVDLAAIERTMRLLPLRGDRGWDDHARLAQLRALLLCADDPDCERRTPRVGRPYP